MFLADGGLVWQRTEKVDANHDLVRGYGLLGAGLHIVRRRPAIDLREGREGGLSGDRWGETVERLVAEE